MPDIVALRGFRNKQDFEIHVGSSHVLTLIKQDTCKVAV